MSNKNQKKQKSESITIDLEIKDNFECIKPNNKLYGCFEKIDNSIEICNAIPCSLIKYKFGLHKKVIKYYLRNNDFFPANEYLQNLIPLFLINCDSAELEYAKNNNDANSKKVSIGCKLFLNDFELEKLENDIIVLSNYDSEARKKAYINAIDDFKEKLLANLTILEHIALDNRKKDVDDLREKYYNIAMVNAQMSDLEVSNIKTPIHKDVKNALNKNGKKPNKI